MTDRKKIINDAVAIYSKLLNEINTNDLLAICEALEETKNNGNKTFVVGNVEALVLQATLLLI